MTLEEGMTTIPIQVYGINLLVRMMAEAPADVRVQLPEGLADPLRRGRGARRRLRRGRQRLPRDARRSRPSSPSRRAPKRSRGTTSTSRARSTASSGSTRSSCPFPQRVGRGPPRPPVRSPTSSRRIDEARAGRAHPRPDPHPQRGPPRRSRRHRGGGRRARRALARAARASTSRSTRSRPGRPNVLAWLGEASGTARCCSRATPTS